MSSAEHDVHGTQWGERTVLITGAAGGLGRALTKRYRELGAAVALVDANEEGLQAVVEETGGATERVLMIPADLAQTAEASRIVSRVDAAFGRLDVLVNNAGVLIRKPIEQMTPEEFDLLTNVNLRAPFFLSQSAVRLMQRHRRGRIINISSIAARTGGAADAAVYAATKAGLIALTKAFARTYASQGILVNAIAPAMMKTPMITEFPNHLLQRMLSEVPMQRLCEPAEVGELVVWLSSDAASYMTGATLDVNGGWVMY